MLIGKLSVAKVNRLITQLPESSRMAGLESGGPEFIGWTTGQYFQAMLIDAVNINTAATIAPYMGKKKVPEPDMVPRPGVKKQGPRVMRIADMKKAMAANQPGGGEKSV